MKALLIVDSDGPNPDWHPPDASKDLIAYQLYCARVPHTITVPKGTVLDGDRCFYHCLPDMTTTPDGRYGVVRAIPLDDDCRTMVEWKKKYLKDNPRGLALMAAAEKEGAPLVAEWQKAEKEAAAEAKAAEEKAAKEAKAESKRAAKEESSV